MKSVDLLVRRLKNLYRGEIEHWYLRSVIGSSEYYLFIYNQNVNKCTFFLGLYCPTNIFFSSCDVCYCTWFFLLPGVKNSVLFLLIYSFDSYFFSSEEFIFWSVKNVKLSDLNLTICSSRPK